MTPPLSPERALRSRCARMYSDQKRRAGLVGISLSYTAAALVALATEAKTCAYCRAALHFGILRFDHAKPTARGGRHELTNLLCCCDRCNRLKGRLDAGEFAELRALLALLHPAAAEDLGRRLLAGGRRYCRR